VIVGEKVVNRVPVKTGHAISCLIGNIGANTQLDGSRVVFIDMLPR
jgi:hypothetical protein